MNSPKSVEQTAYKVATLDSLSQGLQKAIRSIPSHETVRLEPVEASRPASDFLDPAVFAKEQARLFRKLPTPVALSVEMPEPGSVMGNELYGVSIVLTRDKQGVVHAFLNACQHKGSKLVEDCEAHTGGRLSCPYHAWTYALDGQLIGVPREETFLNLDKSAHRLAELPCREIGGIIWAILDHKAEADFSLIPEAIADDFDSLGIGNMHLYGRRTFELDANWKLVLEPFQEAYHVKRLHATTVGPMFADVPGVQEMIGPHSRMISGRVQFTPDMLDVPGENIHKIVTITYQLFPCTVVIGSPYYLSVMIIAPKGVDRSTVEYYMLTQGPPDGQKAEELYARSYEMIQKVFGTEDFRASQITQAGLKTGALEKLTYCGMESMIPRYHKALDAYLAD